MHLDRYWLQAADEIAARSCMLAADSTIEELVELLPGQYVSFKVKDGAYVAFDPKLPVKVLRTHCSQGGHSAAEAFLFRWNQGAAMAVS